MKRILATTLRYAGGACALFTLLCLLANVLTGHASYYDLSSLWISIPVLSSRHWDLFLLIVSLVLLWHAVLPIRARPIRLAGGIAVGLVAAIACANAVQFYAVLVRGTIRTPAIVPTSVFVAAFFAALCVQIVRGSVERPPWSGLRVAWFVVTGILMTAAFPVLLMFTYGPTNYARPADCAVVFGAAVRPGGVPSPALADRVDEGIRLYHAGMVKKLIMSGGVDSTSRYSEPIVMVDRAVNAGVPIDDLLSDQEGVNTVATVRNTERYMLEHGFESVLAVSHYYHLPRIKMLFGRTTVRAYTVPARMARRLAKEPYFILREIAAFYNSLLFQ